MYLTKLKIATAALLTVGLVASGAAALCLPYARAMAKHQADGEQVQQKSAGVDKNDYANTILDKAINAMGGEAKLRKAKVLSWKAKGISISDGKEYPFTNETIVQGLDRLRMEWEDDYDGNRVMGLIVLNGDKGWRKSENNSRAFDLIKLDGDRLANQKRSLYLLIVPVTLVPLKEQGFRIEPAGEVKVDSTPATGLHVTGPDGKEFNLFFDKVSGLPVKLEARLGREGGEYTHEVIFGDYKVMGGIKRATKIEKRNDGTKVLEQEITEFKVLDNLAPETFAAPK